MPHIEPLSEGQMAKQPKTFSPSGYFRVRLEHTLKHTQQTTRLIYLINGGALGLLYFAERLDKLKDYQTVVAALFLGVLSFINLMHAFLIRRQGEWYSRLDKAFASASGAKEIERPKGLGSHALHAAIHFGLAAVLAMAAALALAIK
jgi:hypothetical protein